MEQEAVIKATENLRQTLYEKELHLKAELVRQAPDIAIALSLQRNISEAMGQFEPEMVKHIIRMKKISQEAEKNNAAPNRLVPIAVVLNGIALHF